MTGVEITRVEKGTKFIILYEAMIFLVTTRSRNDYEFKIKVKNKAVIDWFVSALNTDFV